MTFLSTAGSGKSVLWYVNPSMFSFLRTYVVGSSTIIEEIDAMQKSGLASLAIFYYDFKEDEKKDVRALLSIIRMLIVAFFPNCPRNTKMVLKVPATIGLSVV
jgi:hypothetical protein